MYAETVLHWQKRSSDGVAKLVGICAGLGYLFFYFPLLTSFRKPHHLWLFRYVKGMELAFFDELM